MPKADHPVAAITVWLLHRHQAIELIVYNCHKESFIAHSIKQWIIQFCRCSIKFKTSNFHRVHVETIYRVYSRCQLLKWWQSLSKTFLWHFDLGFARLFFQMLITDCRPTPSSNLMFSSRMNRTELRKPVLYLSSTSESSIPFSVNVANVTSILTDLELRPKDARTSLLFSCAKLGLGIQNVSI